MDPHRSFSNSIVKGYSGEDTKRGAFWENNTMSKFPLIFNIYINICNRMQLSKLVESSFGLKKIGFMILISFHMSLFSSLLGKVRDSLHTWSINLSSRKLPRILSD